MYYYKAEGYDCCGFPFVVYALAYTWHNMRGRYTTAEDWYADPVNTITV